MNSWASIGVALGVVLLGVFLVLPFYGHQGVVGADFTGIALAGEAKALDTQFADVDNHPWGAEVMREMVRLGILQGYPRQVTDTYGTPTTKYFAEPEKAISRAEFATLLASSLNLPPKDVVGEGFADWGAIPSWAQSAVVALYSHGIVEGVRGADGRILFLPERQITRAEIAVMVMRALEESEGGAAGRASGGTAGNSAGGAVAGGPAGRASGGTAGGAAGGGAAGGAVPNPFQDVREGDWFYAGVLDAYRQGIVNGRTGVLFAPDANAKRVEVMAVLQRVLEKDERLAASGGEPLETVNDYYHQAEMFLKGGGDKGLRDMLTGGAAYSFNSGGLGFLESAPLPDGTDVRIVKSDEGPKVVSKSGRLAKVTSDVIIYLGSDDDTTPNLQVSVDEEFGLYQTGNGWKIYSVEINGSKGLETS